MKRKLVEYKIVVPAELKKVKLLWKKFLKNDLYWHFALEVSYFELRVSKANPELEEYLKKRKWGYTKRLYKNNTPITRKYQACFDDIYHGYAMLAMTLPKVKPYEFIRIQDCYRVMERCIHLAFNNFTGLGLGSERYALWLILADRTYMAGVAAGVCSEKQKKEEKK